MNTYANTIKHIFLSSLIFIGIVGVGVFALSGVPTVPLKLSVGSFAVRQLFADVVATDQNSHTTYKISPFNDYFYHIDGTMHAVIPYETEGKTVTVTNQNELPWLVSSLLSYGVEQPLAFQAKGTTNTINYEVTKQHGDLTIKRKISYADSTSAKSFGATIQIERDDIVIDDTGRLYTEIDEQTKEALSAVYAMTLTPVDSTNRRVEILGSKIIIINPHAEDMVYINRNEGETVFFDKTYKLLETEIPVVQGQPLVYETTVSIVPQQSLRKTGAVPSAFATLMKEGLWK